MGFGYFYFLAGLEEEAAGKLARKKVGVHEGQATAVCYGAAAAKHIPQLLSTRPLSRVRPRLFCCTPDTSRRALCSDVEAASCAGHGIIISGHLLP